MTSNHLLLYRIAELMLAKGRHVLAVDELFDDEKIGDFVKSIQIDSPYQQMLYEGVLTETVKDEKLHVTFTVEGYFHFILGEVIYDLSKGKDANFLIGLLNSSTLKGIKEGIEQCLIRDIIANQFERLISFIDSGGNNLEICIRPLLYFMKSYGVETMLNKMLENPTDNDWQVLLKLNKLLEELQLQVLRKEFLNSVINRISFTNKYDLQLGLHAIAVIDDEQARMHYKRIDLTINFLQFDSDFLYSLGDCETRFGQYDNALVFHHKNLELKIKTLGGENPTVADSFMAIGILYAKKGLHDKMLEFHHKTLEIRLKIFGEEHFLVAASYGNIGIAYSITHEYDKAIDFFTLCHKLSLKIFGKMHPFVSFSYNNIGNIWYNKGEYDQAIEFFEKSLDIKLKTIGNKHPSVAKSYKNVGQAWKNKGEYEKALEYYEKGLAIELKTLGVEHPSVAKSYNDIGLVWKNKGEYDRSLEYYQKCLEIRMKKFGIEDSRTRKSIANVKEMYQKLGRSNEIPDWMKNI